MPVYTLALAIALLATTDARAMLDDATYDLVQDCGAPPAPPGDSASAFALCMAKCAASAEPHCTVRVPPGGYVTSSTIALVNDTTLLLAAGATVVANPDSDLDAWPVVAPFPSYGRGRNHPGGRRRAVVLLSHVHNAAVRGESDAADSVLDGNGGPWWDTARAGNETVTRGSLLEVSWSENVTIADVTLKDSPWWTAHLYDSDNVTVSRVTVTAPHDSPNTDGFDPDSSRDVLIEDSYVDSGDDCVAIKSGWDCFGDAYGKPTERVTVRNLTCVGPHGSIAVGSEMSGGVRDLVVSDVRFLGNSAGMVNVKFGHTRGGYVRNASFANLAALKGSGLMDTALRAGAYGSANPLCGDDWKPPPSDIDGLTFVDVDATASVCGDPLEGCVHMYGQPRADLKAVHAEGVALPTHGKWQCWHVGGTAGPGNSPAACDAVVPALDGGPS